MRFEVHARDGRSRVAEGTNMLDAFEPGTELIGYSVNGRRFNSTEPVIADGRGMVIEMGQIRRAIAMGAPRTYRPKAG